MGNLGKIIFNAVKKSYAVSADGVSKMPKGTKFDLKNPYILEALPEQKIDEFVKFDGKDLKTVCEALDNGQIRKGFDSGELQALYKKAFSNIKVPTDVNCDAMVYLGSLPESIGSKFDAHGLAKMSVTDQLKQLNNLLANGIDKTITFCTAPLVATKGAGSGLGTSGSAYRDGSFILVGDKGKKLVDDGIKHVIVNDAYYNILSDLQRRFPDVNFVKANEAAEYFSKL